MLSFLQYKRTDMNHGLLYIYIGASHIDTVV